MSILPKCECGQRKSYAVNGKTGKIQLYCPRCHIRCSVCGSIEPRENFCDKPDVQSRTNCKSCYEAPEATWTNLKMHANKNYRLLNGEVRRLNEIGQAAITVGELKALLNALPDDAPIVLTNQCAENGETFHEPEICGYRTFMGKSLYSI